MTRMLIAAAALVVAAAMFWRTERPPLERISGRYLADLDSAVVHVSGALAVASTAAPDSLRALFAAARRHWKAAEYLAEFYNPGTSRAINGAPLPSVEEDDPNRFVKQPEGFQVVEELLFADTVRRTDLTSELQILQASLSRLRQSAATTPLTESNVYEAVRLELLRVVAMGLSGYDSPVAGHSRREAATVFRALATTAADLGGSNADGLVTRLRAAVNTLQSSPSDRSWDLLAFVVDEVIPSARELSRIQKAAGVPRQLDSRSWAVRADYPTDAGALTPLDFGSTDATPATAARQALGLRLLGDPRLSGSDNRACTSCHQPAQAWSDGVRVARALGSGELARNTPSLLNAALQNGSFYDLRTAFLEDQARDVIENPREMHGALGTIATRLRADTTYHRLFREAFGDGETQVVTEQRVRMAIADAVRSLVSLNAPFDRYLRGDRDALSDSARRGFNLFMGKARCGTCHFFPLFNGSVPPQYRAMESEVLGVPATAQAPWKLSPDSGRARLIPSPVYLGAIKTTTVRNAAVTAPYMHNGVFATLDQVLDFYNRGGGRGLGLNVPNQTLPADSLGLSARERQDLLAFVHALTDTTRANARLK